MTPPYSLALCHAYPTVQGLLQRLRQIDDTSDPHLHSPTTTPSVSTAAILIVWWYILSTLFLLAQTSTRIQCRTSK